MPRLARVVAVEIPHHVTQRGNARRFILETDADRTVYLSLLRQDVELCGVSLVGYCLMSNHVHLVAIPHKAMSCRRLCDIRTGAMRRIGTPLTNRVGMYGKGVTTPARWIGPICGEHCVIRN